MEVNIDPEVSLALIIVFVLLLAIFAIWRRSKIGAKCLEELEEWREKVRYEKPPELIKWREEVTAKIDQLDPVGHASHYHRILRIIDERLLTFVDYNT